LAKYYGKTNSNTSIDFLKFGIQGNMLSENSETFIPKIKRIASFLNLEKE
jgi:hypothetical protein